MTSELIVLGSSNAVPSPGHTNTHLAILTPGRRVLIDCGTNPVITLSKAGVDVNTVTDIVLTHFHPDHIGSLPLLLMDMWLMGRREQLNIYGLNYTIERAKMMLDLYTWESWPDLYPVQFSSVAQFDQVVVLEDAQMRITASPVKHFLPAMCLRVDFMNGARSVAYSGDTEPCQAVVDISRGADILLHEATGAEPGHSSAGQAGETARLSGARALYLIHYAAERLGDPGMLAEARAEFAGEVYQAVDLMRIPLD